MPKIYAHHDADGLISAYFAKLANPNHEIEVTEEFGDYKENKTSTIMVDMRPKDSKFKGLVLDHHPDHTSLADRNYKLIWDNKPASIICLEYFREKIPEKEYWKVVIGAAGDGQVEKVPAYIFEKNKMLMMNVSTYMNKWSGDWNFYFLPLYQALSSAINAFARYGEYDVALNLIEGCKSPLELLTHPDVDKQKYKLNRERKDIMKNVKLHDFGALKVAVFNSPNIRLSGYVASTLEEAIPFTTILAINEDNGSLSLRGKMSLYYKSVLEKTGLIEVAGHPGFMGGKLKTSVPKFISTLVEIL